MRTAWARDANQQFARSRGERSAGAKIAVTRRARPVAVLAPFRRQGPMPEQKAAIARVVEMMRRSLVHNISLYAIDTAADPRQASARAVFEQTAAGAWQPCGDVAAGPA